MKALDAPATIEFAPEGGSVKVSLRPDGLQSVGPGKLGGKTYEVLVTLADGSPAILKGGSRLWSLLAPHQRRADEGKAAKLTVGKTGEGTATAWTVVIA